jgi:hypothetical protein
MISGIAGPGAASMVASLFIKIGYKKIYGIIN